MSDYPPAIVSPLVLVAATRYALSRQSYMCSAISADLVANAHRLPPGTREVIVRDIDLALSDRSPFGNVVSEVDVPGWHRAREALTRLDDPAEVAHPQGDEVRRRAIARVEAVLRRRADGIDEERAGGP